MDLHLRTCSDAAYNRTAFPTPLAHRSREAVEASPEYVLLGVLHHLLEGQCNPDLRLLGCAVLAPRCEGGRAPRPCRRVCEGLREACLPAFDAIDMAWPYFLDCGRYFGGDEEGCYDPLEKLRGERGGEGWGGPGLSGQASGAPSGSAGVVRAWRGGRGRGRGSRREWGGRGPAGLRGDAVTA